MTPRYLLVSYTLYIGVIVCRGVGVVVPIIRVRDSTIPAGWIVYIREYGCDDCRGPEVRPNAPMGR